MQLGVEGFRECVNGTMVPTPRQCGQMFAKPFCQPSVSVAFDFLAFAGLVLFCANFSDSLVTAERFNLSRT
jgi:hypothetical protein